MELILAITVAIAGVLMYFDRWPIFPTLLQYTKKERRIMNLLGIPVATGIAYWLIKYYVHN